MRIAADFPQFKAAALIKFAGLGIGIHHFKGYFAVSAGAGGSFDGFKKLPTDATTLVIFADVDVVDVQKRLGNKGGKSHKTDGNADKNIARLSEKNAGRRVRAKLFDQSVPHRLRQRLPLAKRRAGVAIEQIDDRGGVGGIFQIGFDDQKI